MEEEEEYEDEKRCRVLKAVPRSGLSKGFFGSGM